MSNKKRKKPVFKADNTKKKRKFPTRKLLILLGTFAVVFSAYQIALYFMCEWIIHAYCIAIGVTAVIYITVNRGLFSVPKKDRLTDEWSDGEKDAFIAEQIKRKKNSEFLLYILVSLILTVIYDMIYIFITLNLGVKL